MTTKEVEATSQHQRQLQLLPLSQGEHKLIPSPAKSPQQPAVTVRRAGCYWRGGEKEAGWARPGCRDCRSLDGFRDQVRDLHLYAQPMEFIRVF